MKRILTYAILVVILYSINISAYAINDSSNVITPYYVVVTTTDVNLKIENSHAISMMYSLFDSNKDVDIVATLFYSSNKYNWTAKKSWNISYENVNQIDTSRTYQVLSTGYYKLNVVINVYTLSGVFIESVENNKVVYYGGSGSYK